MLITPSEEQLINQPALAGAVLEIADNGGYRWHWPATGLRRGCRGDEAADALLAALVATQLQARE